MHKLSNLIKERKEPIDRLSRNTGISKGTIKSLFTGQRQPSLLTIKKICAYFGVDYKDYI